MKKTLGTAVLDGGQIKSGFIIAKKYRHIFIYKIIGLFLYCSVN